jgi:hypothetical protein
MSLFLVATLDNGNDLNELIVARIDRALNSLELV